MAKRDRNDREDRKEKKRKKERRRSPSPSESSDDDHDRLERRAAKKLAKQRAKKEAKLNAMTTLEKEERKKRKRLETTAERFGYSNDDNPFGDQNLDAQFLWKKKVEKEGGAAQPSKQVQKALQKKNFEEIEKVRARRKEREEEMEEMERLRAEEARLTEQSKYGDWMKKEEEFHLEQAKMRSKIRLVEGREKPIDVLAKNVLLFGEDEEEGGVGIKYQGKSSLDMSHLEMELREPHELFEGLSVQELDELAADIRNYQELQSTGDNVEFWASLAVVCEEELRLAQSRAGKEDTSVRAVHKSVLEGVHNELRPLSYSSLQQTEDEIKKKLESDNNSGTVDVEYYEMVLRVAKVYMAKARLHDHHQVMLHRQLQKLDRTREALRLQREEARERGELLPEDAAEGAGGGAAAAAAAGAAAAVGGAVDDGTQASAMFSLEASKGMEDLEDAFNLKDEVDLSGTTYSWADKYRPRKPRFFNRVKTGYDWNKYNQAHYDHDNPPPKTVQGYKFNVFYPDLLDKTKTPRFFLEKAAGSDDFAILRFSAGPPYEDLAFQIMNREWEISKKRGFKSSFDRGVLTLCFNFKRARYRR